MSALDRYPSPRPTPEQFEREVRGILDAMAVGLVDYRSEHRAVVGSGDGEYEIDIAVRFSALGANFLVLVECKRHSAPVKREVLLSLHSKMASIAAQKAMVFSTSGFQSGALEFAAAHRIATVQICDGRSSYFTRSVGEPPEPPPWANIPAIVGWLIRNEHYSIVSHQHPEYLREAISSETRSR